MGDLSRRKIEPDKAILDVFSFDGDGQQGRERSTEAVVGKVVFVIFSHRDLLSWDLDRSTRRMKQTVRARQKLLEIAGRQGEQKSITRPI